MNKRIEYIDQAKGLAMFLVVMGHLYYFSIINQEASEHHPLFEVVLQLLQMPLFVFMSGMVINTKFKTMKEIFQDLTARFKKLVLPMLFVGSAYAVFIAHTPIEFLQHDMKYGYWYLLTLFEFYMLSYPYVRLSYIKNEYLRHVVPIGYLVLMSLVIHQCAASADKNMNCWQNYLGLGQIDQYYWYFFSAILIRRYNLLDKLFNSKWLYEICLILMIVVLFLFMNNQYYVGMAKIGSCSILFVTVYLIRKASTQQTIANKLLNYIGRNSLSIYVYHYFFVWTLNLDFLLKDLFTVHENFLVSCIILPPPVLLIMIMSVMVSKLFKQCKYLSHILP